MIYGRTPQEDQDVVPTVRPDHICHVFEVLDEEGWNEETQVDSADVAEFQHLDVYYD
jgi:hypothetical protein